MLANVQTQRHVHGRSIHLRTYVHFSKLIHVARVRANRLGSRLTGVQLHQARGHAYTG